MSPCSWNAEKTASNKFGRRLGFDTVDSMVRSKDEEQLMSNLAADAGADRIESRWGNSISEQPRHIHRAPCAYRNCPNAPARQGKLNCGHSTQTEAECR